jgi:serine/threonine protein kinase
MEDRAPLPGGSTIAHYQLIARVGIGGMGEVYKAFDVTLDRYVALKLLASELLDSSDRVRRFVQEAKSASALNHPNIVTIHEIGQADVKLLDEHAPALPPVYYIAMEYIDGATLRRHIYTEPDPRLLVDLLAQAADGLAKAHAAGIVHRDLKPDNIMVSVDGYAKLVDFGLAKLTENRESTEKTQEGVVMGTIGYMAPEQVRGEEVDHRADIFSFGCIVYEAAARRQPFAADTSIDTLHRIMFTPAAPLPAGGPMADLQSIVTRALAKKPGERYGSIRELAADLREVRRSWDAAAAPAKQKAPEREEIPPAAPAVSPRDAAFRAPEPPPRHGRSSWIAPLVPLALAGGIVWFWVTHPEVERLGSEPVAMASIMSLSAADAAGTAYEWRDAAEIAPSLSRAVVAALDPDFHIRRSLGDKAAKDEIRTVLEKRTIPRASPISRGVARSLYTASSGPLSKMREIVVAYDLEQELSKERIVELFLNTAEFGPGVFGAEAAAQSYFDRPASKLTLSQSALLAAALLDPRASDPSQPDEALEARQKIILGMLEEPEAPAARERREKKETAKKSSTPAPVAETPAEVPAEAPPAPEPVAPADEQDSAPVIEQPGSST